MSGTVRSVFAWSCALCVLAADAHGTQNASPRPESQSADWSSEPSIGFWAGMSRSSRGPFGLVAGRSMGILGIGLRYPIQRRQPAWLLFTADLLPFLFAGNNRTGDIQVVPGDHGLRAGFGDTTTAVGVGILPVGVRVSPIRRDNLRIGVGVSGGFVAFNQPVPFGNANRLNFLTAASFDLELAVTRNVQIWAGYVLHHVSTAGHGIENPGLDANTYYVGAGKTLRRRK